MTTSRRPWLGFGILTGLLVLCALGTVAGLRVLDRSFDAVALVIDGFDAQRLR